MKQKLKNKADKLCRQLVQLIGICEKCGSKQYIQWCHIHTRGIGKLRYDRRNWFVLCASCHRHFHNKPLEFALFVIKVKGKEVHDWLIKESNKLEPLTISWYNKVIEDLKNKLDGSEGVLRGDKASKR